MYNNTYINFIVSLCIGASLSGGISKRGSGSSLIICFKYQLPDLELLKKNTFLIDINIANCKCFFAKQTWGTRSQSFCIHVCSIAHKLFLNFFRDTRPVIYTYQRSFGNLLCKYSLYTDLNIYSYQFALSLICSQNCCLCVVVCLCCLCCWCCCCCLETTIDLVPNLFGNKPFF